MVRPYLNCHSLRRLLGLLAVSAVVSVLSPSAAFAQPDSPYAYGSDPDQSFDSPFVDVDAMNLDPGVSGSQIADDPEHGPTSSLVGVDPAVDTNDKTTQPAELGKNGNPIQSTGLPKTGQEIIERVAFAMLLVAVGMVALEARPRRRTWSR